VSPLRRIVPAAFPVGRAAAALWAWRHRQEIAGWAGYAAKALPRILAREHPDVLTEGRLRARLATDPVTRNVDGLRVSVRDGVATLSGLVHADVHDAALAIATNTGGVLRVRDELQDRRRRSLLHR
jgi:hypothetical protein